MRLLPAALLACLCACAAVPLKPNGPPPFSGGGTIVVFGARVEARNAGVDEVALSAAFQKAAEEQAKGLKIITQGEAARLLHGLGVKQAHLERSGLGVVEALKFLGAEFGVYGVVDRAETIGIGMLAVMVNATGDRSGEWMRGGQPELTADLSREMGALLQDLGASTTEPVKYSDGMVLEITELGKGVKPRLTDKVKVHYEGKLESGVVFDSSVKRGEPAVFGLDRVITCWQEAIPKLRVGGKGKLTCPPGIAYGDRGQSPMIPANATLHFSVELLGIEK